MQNSFSIVQDDDDEEIFEDEASISLPPARKPQSLEDFNEIPRKQKSSAGPSGRHPVLKKSHQSSDSDSETDAKNPSIPGEYNAKDYENLDTSPEIREIFQYITKYIPQTMSLDYKFKPFVPEYLPAVGDIDAFLKIIPPDKTLSGEDFTDYTELGLVVLDEPAANQSDAALLHLQLRAESVKSTSDSGVVVKKVDNVEKNVKIIDKWIKDISALHKSKSLPIVKYTEQMPDLDELMQEWPEDIEKQLKDQGFPEATGSLEEYIEEVCGLLQIPAKNKIQALHVLFSLYAAVKSSQLFQSTVDKGNDDVSFSGTDQLVLD